MMPGRPPTCICCTALRPVLSRLSAAEAAEFEAEYGRRLLQAYPAGPAGTPFAFRRVFVVARLD